ncbi:MAG TPA: hypothetical protein VG271_13490 [Beijerinckiaceae bacterium]|jgi:hypothetical protein|nr:hypothetical protein [Beijerinckiaceae bacterium]
MEWIFWAAIAVAVGLGLRRIAAKWQRFDGAEPDFVPQIFYPEID